MRFPKLVLFAAATVALAAPPPAWSQDSERLLPQRALWPVSSMASSLTIRQPSRSLCACYWRSRRLPVLCPHDAPRRSIRWRRCVTNEDRPEPRRFP